MYISHMIVTLTSSVLIVTIVDGITLVVLVCPFCSLRDDLHAAIRVYVDSLDGIRLGMSRRVVIADSFLLTAIAIGGACILASHQR